MSMVEVTSEEVQQMKKDPLELILVPLQLDSA